MKHLNFFCIALLFAACSGGAGVLELSPVFSDNMVLQQQSTVPIWGKAAPKANVDVTPSWGGNTYGTKTDANGNWKTAVPTPEAGGPYTIIIRSGLTKDTLKNVMLGEVWICSGQSNMEMPLAGWGRVQNFEQEIAAANYPNIRLLQLDKQCNVKPQENFTVQGGGWQVCSPAAIANFSSTAYFFGRDLHQSLGDVPIGLINTSWGGTVAEAWTSAGSLAAMHDFDEALTLQKGQTNESLEALYRTQYEEWNQQLQAADASTGKGWEAADFGDADWKTMKLPALWEERGLSNFDGIVWFRTTIDVPQSWAGKELTLALGEIDDNDVTYFNGTQVGATDGYNIPRQYTVPAELVKAGKNLVAVRVTDGGGGGGLWAGQNNFYVQLADNQKITLAGNWKYNIALDLKSLAPQPVSPSHPNRPSVLYNAMIHPLVQFPIKGAIWYQGESNSSRAEQYRTLFPLLINDWRKQWGYDFPFYFVQLANYKANASENWPALREAQWQTLSVPNTGMAVTIDIGDAKDIHPKNKQEVGKRLALWAKAKTYEQDLPYSGPLYSGYKVEGSKIRLSFTHTDGGLKSSNGKALKGFIIAGNDKKFYEADAKIVGNEVVVSSPKVAHPISVRYAWKDHPEGANLSNGAGLPASPLRTDDF